MNDKNRRRHREFIGTVELRGKLDHNIAELFTLMNGCCFWRQMMSQVLIQRRRAKTTAHGLNHQSVNCTLILSDISYSDRREKQVFLKSCWHKQWLRWANDCAVFETSMISGGQWWFTSDWPVTNWLTKWEMNKTGWWFWTFCFSIHWEKSSQLTNSFRRGWNHQPVMCVRSPQCFVCFKFIWDPMNPRPLEIVQSDEVPRSQAINSLKTGELLQDSQENICQVASNQQRVCSHSEIQPFLGSQHIGDDRMTPKCHIVGMIGSDMYIHIYIYMSPVSGIPRPHREGAPNDHTADIHTCGNIEAKHSKIW